MGATSHAPDAIVNQTSRPIAEGVYRLWQDALAGKSLGPATEALAESAAKPLFLANLLGRSRLLQMTRGEFSAADNLNIAPTFEEAIAKLVARSPMLAAMDRESVAEIMQGGGLAFAKAASIETAKRAKDAILTAMARGVSERDAASALQQQTAWPISYAQTAYRTVAGQAYIDGQKEQAADPALNGAIVAWEFSATGDDDTRINHLRCDGVTAAIGDPIWQKISPLLGYNCRCSLLPVTRQQAKRRFGGEIPRGVIPPGAGPDPGFRPG